MGEHRQGVYYYRPQENESVGRVAVTKEGRLWHKRLGHPSKNIFPYFSNLVGCNLNWNSDAVCDSCCRAKQSRTLFKPNNKRCDVLFGLIHCDIWGPYRVTSLTRASYFLTIVDDHSRGVWVYLMKEKGEAGDLMKMFCQMVKTQFETCVKIIQSDKGTELLSIHRYYEENGILFQTSNTNTPQQNGRVERKHRHILEKARALRFQGGLPLHFWGECILTAAYLINRTPTPLLDGKTPYELLYRKKPHLDNLKGLGCLCYAHYKTRDKFDERGKRCIFIGYPHSKKGWKVYDLKERWVFVSRDIIFYENVFPYLISNYGADTQQGSNHDLSDYPGISDAHDHGKDSHTPHVVRGSEESNQEHDGIQEQNEGISVTEHEDNIPPGLNLHPNEVGNGGESDNDEGEVIRVDAEESEKMGRGAREKFKPV